MTEYRKIPKRRVKRSRSPGSKSLRPYFEKSAFAEELKSIPLLIVSVTKYRKPSYYEFEVVDGFNDSLAGPLTRTVGLDGASFATSPSIFESNRDELISWLEVEKTRIHDFRYRKSITQADYDSSSEWGGTPIGIWIQGFYGWFTEARPTWQFPGAELERYLLSPEPPGRIRQIITANSKVKGAQPPKVVSQKDYESYLKEAAPTDSVADEEYKKFREKRIAFEIHTKSLNASELKVLSREMNRQSSPLHGALSDLYTEYGPGAKGLSVYRSTKALYEEFESKIECITRTQKRRDELKVKDEATLAEKELELGTVDWYGNVKEAAEDFLEGFKKRHEPTSPYYGMSFTRASYKYHEMHNFVYKPKLTKKQFHENVKKHPLKDE